MNCRFNGHVDKFYSVAEHSVLVSHLVPREDALWGLLHDASEAFVPDVPRPFKPIITGFDEFESRLFYAAALHWDLPLELPESVKHIDRNIVADEAATLFREVPDWIAYYEHVCDWSLIRGLSPEVAKLAFLDRYKELMP